MSNVWIVTYLDEDQCITDFDVISHGEAELLKQLVNHWRDIQVDEYTGTSDRTNLLLEHARAGRKSYDVRLPWMQSIPGLINVPPTVHSARRMYPYESVPTHNMRFRGSSVIVWAESEEGAIARAKALCRAQLLHKDVQGRRFIDVLIETAKRDGLPNARDARRELMTAFAIDEHDLID